MSNRQLCLLLFLIEAKKFMAKKSEITYSEAMAEIEQIIARFRAEELSVDDLQREVKRATELIALCKERLLKAETSVKKILEP